MSPHQVLPDAGSSNLIFPAFRHRFTHSSHALVLDPTYGPKAHTLERVIGCTVDRVSLRRDASTMGARLGSHAIRIAVKDDSTNSCMIEIIRGILRV